MPLKGFLFAVNPDSKVILLTDCDLAGMKNSPRTIIEPKQTVAVIFEPSALYERRQVRANVGDFQPCDVFRQVLRVRADITHTPGAATLLGVSPPNGLLLTCLLQRRCQPALRILYHNLANLTELALPDYVPGQLDHRVTRVIMHQAEYLSGLLHNFSQLLCFFHVERHRFFAHHVEASFKKIPRNRKMPVVRRGDRNEIYPFTLWQLKLTLNHLLVIAEYPLGIEIQLTSHLLRFARVDVERPCHQLDSPVHTSRFAVHLTDKRSRPPTNHSHLQLSAEFHTCPFQKTFAVNKITILSRYHKAVHYFLQTQQLLLRVRLTINYQRAAYRGAPLCELLQNRVP
ncbi:hypothetical protein ES703_69050 [subsurface metagenome]